MPPTGATGKVKFGKHGDGVRVVKPLRTEIFWGHKGINSHGIGLVQSEFYDQQM